MRLYKRKPDWLKVKYSSEGLLEVKRMLKRLSLNTVCEEANCPNIAECFGRKTATFMILGSVCTRNCTFCNVKKDRAPQDVDPEEPERVARAVEELNLKHVVITSVTRDDLPDGGAGHFAAVINSIKHFSKKITVEVLIPDFKGSDSALAKVVKAGPDIINHNVETVPRLYPEVRPMAVYQRSLQLLQKVGEMNEKIVTKSGLMLGLGEEEEEVIGVLKDLRDAECQVVTIGQYLAPSNKHHPVREYVHPDVFEYYHKKGMELGFKYVASAPLVRSSYQAERVTEKLGV